MKAPEPRRRSRSNDGTPSRISRVMPIRPELLAKLIAEFHKPIERRAPKLYHGPRAATGHGAVVLGDDQVLQVRRMRHWYGMSVQQIADALGMRPTQIDGLCEYRNRVHLDPGPRPEHVAREIEAA